MVESKIIPRLKPLFLYIQPCPLPVGQLDCTYFLETVLMNLVRKKSFAEPTKNDH